MNNMDRELPLSNELEMATGAMRAIEPALPSQDLMRSTTLAMAQGARRRHRRVVARRLVAAGLVAAAGLVIVFAQASPTVAFADVAKEVSATRTLRAQIINSKEGEGTFYQSGTRVRFESPALIAISDSATGQEILLDLANKLAYRMPERDVTRSVDFYAMIRSLAESASTPAEPYVDENGERFPGLSGSAAVDMGAAARWQVDVTVWSNAKSNLPVRADIRPVEGGPSILLQRITFDVPLEESLFDMAIPAGFQTVGLSQADLKPPLSEEEAQKLVMEPGVGMGEVRFGMTRGEVAAVLGEPEFTIHGTYLSYPSKGLQIVLGGRQADKVGMMIANPADAGSLTRHEFPGRTDMGIRIGSGLQEVKDAYGEPDAPLPSDNNVPRSLTMLRYNRLGLWFSLNNGKVGQIGIVEPR